MNEWWQQSDDDVPASIPRRDSIPEARFSEPDDVASPPESAAFIPEWRVKRRVIAIIVSLAGLAAIAWAGYDIYEYLTATCPGVRSSHLGRYMIDSVVLVASIGAIGSVWRWANQKDPRDFRWRSG